MHTSFRMAEKEMTDADGGRHGAPAGGRDRPSHRAADRRREPYALDVDKLIEAAVRTGTFLEINANPNRRDLNDIYAREAARAGAKLVIDSDAHGTETLANMRYGVATARRGWLTKADVANTRDVEAARTKLRKRAAARPVTAGGSILRAHGVRSSLGSPNGELRSR